MSVSSGDFISLAERLLESDKTEIGWRIVAGRAYYGAFHYCAEVVAVHPATIPDPAFNTHERVYRAVANLPITALGAKDLKQLIYLTKNLRDIRTFADYELKGDFLRERAVQAIAAAKNIENLRAKFRNTHGI